VPLLKRGVTATLHGPFEGPGMDPVYILHLDSGSREAEASLFRGGTLLLAGFYKGSAEAETSSIEVASEGELTTLLANVAERACPG
jgi:hypothetical protein